MSYPVNHSIAERTVSAVSFSIASTPLACAVIAPFSGRLDRLAGVSHGTFTANCSVAIAIIPAVAGGVAPGAGVAVSGSPMTLTASNSAAGTGVALVPGARTFVNEGDLIVFTPSGSTGTTIGGTFSATIARA